MNAGSSQSCQISAHLGARTQLPIQRYFNLSEVFAREAPFSSYRQNIDYNCRLLKEGNDDENFRIS
jgi:hypothetical protein